MGSRSLTHAGLVTGLSPVLAGGLICLAAPVMPALAQASAADGTGSTAVGADPLLAQNTPEPADESGDNPAPVLQEVVVTGFRGSLAKSTTAKRDAIGFTDSIYSEDIGKFPDNNIAESFNRIPGITIVRDITGQGVDIAIRGLGPNFTKVLLNGAPVAIASTGTTDAQNTNQEVDLNMFPTELFTSLTVQKTSSADMLEGGAAGTVNMRSARPFDTPGRHVAFGVQGTERQNAGPWGERGYLVASNTWENGFGALIGGVVVRDNVNTPGFETIGWTNPQLSTVRPASGTSPAVTAAQAQCLAPSNCNSTGGGNWTIPGTVPATAGNGLVPGTVINQAFLLAANPGASITQIDNGIIPRLGRVADERGAQDRYNSVLSLEYRPNDSLHFYMDNMFGKEHNVLTREDMDWVGRNGAMIPINETFDRGDCTSGCVVRSATFANSQFFLEYRPYFEDTDFWGTNPGLNWRANDWLSGDIQANYTKSTFHREVPSVLVTTPGDVTINYTNNGGVPVIASNVNLNDPANFFWAGSRVNIQDERRATATKGIRGDVSFGRGGAFNVKTGFAYDDQWRHIDAYDNSQAWQNAVCGDNPNVYLQSPNSQPPCEGLDTAAPGAKYPTYPGLGTGFSTGMSGPVLYRGSLIPQSALASYIMPGPAGFVTVDWSKFAAASDYGAFHANEPSAGSSNTGASGGYVRNSDTGLYVEFNGDTTIRGHGFRYVAGVRWVRTLQYIGGLVSLPDPRNAQLCGGKTGISSACDGAFYPNVLNFVTTENSYNNTLPSLELVYNIMPSFLARFAASKTMTRPNPNSMLPGLNFSSPSADVGTVGNPALSPYISKNLDFGLEYYTGKEGYVALALFRKKITGFTANGNTTVPFSALAPYGVTYSTLTPTQQAAIDSRGGPDAASVVLTEQVNATGVLTVNGQEVDWVQPLDFLTRRIGFEGLGFQANYTHISQTGTGAAPAVATGVPPDTYNLTGYYEHGPVSVRLSEVYNAANVSSGLNQNGIPLAAIYAASYREWDLSSYVDIGKLLHWPMGFQITADALNLFDAKQRSYFQFPNATFTEYNPGRELMIGFRAKF
ncbi:MAG TPA: TonB-dependent receptor [Steroidobacteraceae bacterium]|nr:TonB-dependent receptor [Steroidobacteraceae bacterium]